MGPLALLGIGAASGLAKSAGSLVSGFANGIWNRDNQAYLQENAKNQQLDLISKYTRYQRWARLTSVTMQGSGLLSSLFL